MQEPVIIGIANEYNQNHINTGHIKIQMLVTVFTYDITEDKQ